MLAFLTETKLQKGFHALVIRLENIAIPIVQVHQPGKNAQPHFVADPGRQVARQRPALSLDIPVRSLRVAIILQPVCVERTHVETVKRLFAIPHDEPSNAFARAVHGGAAQNLGGIRARRDVMDALEHSIGTFEAAGGPDVVLKSQRLNFLNLGRRSIAEEQHGHVSKDAVN